MNLGRMYRAIIALTLKWYCNSYITRKAIDGLVIDVNEFISTIYVPLLMAKITNEVRNQCSDTVYYKIISILEDNKEPFRSFLTEELRFSIYQRDAFLLRPEKISINIEDDLNDLTKDDLDNPKGILAKVPLAHSLKIFFELPGVYDEITKYIQKLGDDNMISNFLQAKLWTNKYQIENQSKNVYPLFLFYDDFETGNALGSHSGKLKLGGVYIKLPFLPPAIVSKLRCIFLSTIFYAKDHMKLGNIFVFESILSELNDLATNGILINVNGAIKKIYFCLAAVLGDNLGMNAYCGFSESFKAKYYCRICTANSDECNIMTHEEKTLLRTKEVYDYNVKNNKKEKGIKEECIFNCIYKFHITENRCVDIMHDIFEGIARYTLGKILTRFIYVDKFFSIRELNRRIKNFKYPNFETVKPQALFMSYSKKDKTVFGTNKKIKFRQSAAETLCLIRYLSVIIGDRIPRNNLHWKLYLTLREITHLVTSPRVTKHDPAKLTNLIYKHNALYRKLFGFLKPKMHLWWHYGLIMEMMGPLVHLDGMVFERKNKEVKETSAANFCYKNVPLTLAYRYQLKLSYSKISSEILSFSRVNTSSQGKDMMIRVEGKDDCIRCKTYNSIKIYNKMYSTGNVIIVGYCKNYLPLFRRIEIIYECNEKIYFITSKIMHEYFDTHYYAYKVALCGNETEHINLSKIPETALCGLVTVEETVNYIVKRHEY